MGGGTGGWSADGSAPTGSITYNSQTVGDISHDAWCISGGWSYRDWQTIPCWDCEVAHRMMCSTCGGIGAVNVFRDGTIKKLKQEEPDGRLDS